jgi:hypothetical protein
LETDSYWWPLEGLCYDGPLKDTMLDSIPVVHCTWGEWRARHPETDVLAPPDDPKHGDSRGGHGAEEYWERPGIDQLFINSLYQGNLDRQMPEQVMVMGINVLEGVRAYPVSDVKLEGGVVNDDIHGFPVLVVCGPDPESFYTGSFDRRIGEQVLEFEAQGDRLKDKQTGTLWDPEGLAVEGELKGTQLQPVHGMMGRWHTWIYPHPQTELWRTQRKESPNVEAGIFERLLEGLREALHNVRVEREILNLERPLESDRGLVIDIDGDPFLVHHFKNQTAARDYAHFYNAHDHKTCIRSGLYVLQSNPQQYADIALNGARLPDDHIQWSKLVDNEDFNKRVEQYTPEEDLGEDYAGFGEIVEGLNANGYDCFPGAPELHADITYWYPWGTYTGLRPGEDNWFTVTVETMDPFEIHRFATIEGAEEFLQTVKHAFRIGRYVFYSTPVNKFILPRFRMVDRPDDRVDWSEFLEDDNFRQVLQNIIQDEG